MNLISRAYYVLRYLGPRFVALRTGVYLRHKLGITRRTFARRPWDSIALENITSAGTPTTADGYARFKRNQSLPFLFPLGSPPEIPLALRQAQCDRHPDLSERLRLLEQDRCIYFSHTPSPEAIEWYHNPFEDTRGEADAVWCDIPDFLPKQGDPRVLWEPSRAAWAIDFGRARSHRMSIDTGPLFWRWVDSWMSACPPFSGFQWKCGQESSIRLIAIAFGFWSLGGEPATTGARWIQFARLAWATGYRVQHHIRFAISQKNNHALSEACGLLLISHLFPEFRASSVWKALGRRIFARELLRQTYADGSYIQHSMNYHRVMLQVAVLAMRLAELEAHPFPQEVYDRVRLCGEFLFQMTDPQTGRTPNYGNNDGACVLPLSECDFTDFRPVVQATYFLVQRERCLPSGPWDEDLVWLFGRDALSCPRAQTSAAGSSAFDVGGYYTLRAGESSCMIRCHTFRNRPSHHDPLHVDLSWRGLNVLQDCGTYRYYVAGRPDIESYFRSVRAHNTIEVGGVRSVEWVSRFLFFPWPRGRKLRFEAVDAGGPTTCFEGERYEPDRFPTRLRHRRSVIGISADAWIVVDELLGTGEHDLVLRWHLIDAPYEIDVPKSRVVLHTSSGPVSLCVIGRPTEAARLEVIHGRDDVGGVQGFAAPYYGRRRPIPAVEALFRCQLPQRIITLLGLGVAVSGRLGEADRRIERWDVRAGNAAYRVELAPLSLRATRTFLRCTATDGPVDVAAITSRH